LRLLAVAALIKSIRANGPCGCTLTVGDQVTVNGLPGRGIVVARKGRRLAVRFRDGMYVSRDQRDVNKIRSDYVSQYSSNRETNMVLNAGEVTVEQEGGPLKRPTDSYIVKQGALHCVKSYNQQDVNFGCFNSREEAEAHLAAMK
jgi:hypothetical protein